MRRSKRVFSCSLSVIFAPREVNHQQTAIMSQCTTTQDVLVKLEQAVERGDVPYLHALLINQNLTGEIVGFFNGSQTLLHRACIYGARECVIALLALGANPHAVDENKSTALHLTINDPADEMDGRINVPADATVHIVETLLQAGAKVDAVDDWGETPWPKLR